MSRKFRRYVEESVDSLTLQDCLTFLWVSGGLLCCFLWLLSKPGVVPSIGIAGRKAAAGYEVTQGVGEASDEAIDLGTYALPSMSVTVGSREHHLTFSAVLEFDRTALRESFSDKFDTPEAELNFFERHLAKIQDAIVLHASDVTATDERRGLYVEGLRLGLPEAINDSLTSAKEVVRTVYFNSFQVIAAE